MDEPVLFVSAGDPSGDTACARLIDSLRVGKPGLKIFGLGGAGLRERGQVQFAEPSDLAVLGFWEVARRFFFFRALMNRCVAEINKQRPNAILLVDYPGFNLRLARRIKSLGIPIIYYISPQVWAWGRRRLKEIRELVDRMLVILPFEKDFYREHDVPCDFVGHYLLEDIPAEMITSDPPGSSQIALLPGSRRVEIERMLPPMLDAAKRLHREHGLSARVAAVSGAYDYNSACSGYEDHGVKVVYDDARRVVYESDIVLTASGTATLETGIIARPMVVVYRTGMVTYQIARRLVRLDRIALVNLVLGKKVVPELIQSEVTGERMAAEVGRYLTEEEYCRQTTVELKRTAGVLGGVGASERASELVAGVL